MIVFFVLLFILAAIFPLTVYLVSAFNRPPEPSGEILDAELLFPEKHTDTQNWWESRRPFFNQCLGFAGLGAFLLYHLLAGTASGDPATVNAGGYFFFLQLLAYLVYMGAANLFYNLGAILETAFGTKEPDRFRKKTLRMMTAIALIIPVLVVVLFYL